MYLNGFQLHDFDVSLLLSTDVMCPFLTECAGQDVVRRGVGIRLGIVYVDPNIDQVVRSCIYGVSSS